MEACAAYGTLNTQQTERRDSTECPAYEVVERQQEVEQDGRNVYENAETFVQSQKDHTLNYVHAEGSI